MILNSLASHPLNRMTMILFPCILIFVKSPIILFWFVSVQWFVDKKEIIIQVKDWLESLQSYTKHITMRNKQQLRTLKQIWSRCLTLRFTSFLKNSLNLLLLSADISFEQLHSLIHSCLIVNWQPQENSDISCLFFHLCWNKVIVCFSSRSGLLSLTSLVFVSSSDIFPSIVLMGKYFSSSILPLDTSRRTTTDGWCIQHIEHYQVPISIRLISISVFISYLRGIYISCFLRDAICDFSFPRIPSMYANHADMPPNMTTKMPLIVLSQILFQFKTNHLRPKSIFHIINKPIKINTANKIEPIEARNNPNL